MIGAASRDIATDDPRGWRLGGAVSYASLTLARLGVPTRALIGVDGEAEAATELGVLRDAGVEVATTHLETGPVFENLEGPTGRVQRCRSISRPMAPNRLPAGWARAAEAVILGPVADELADEWFAVPNDDAFVALGWQGLLRSFVVGRDVERVPPADRPLVRRADLIGVSTDDVGTAARLRDLVDLMKPGATLVVTRGDRGGTAITSRRPARSTLRAYPAIPSNGEIDPTGAGDVFLATLVATAIDGERLGAVDWPDRLRLAAAAGSLAVEGLGLAGVPELRAIRRRVAEVA